MSDEIFWWCIGALGGGFFGGRMIIQLWISERRGESVVTPIFWYLSLAGSLTLLAYSLHRSDPVFVIAQAIGVGVYSRNLWLTRRTRVKLTSTAQPLGMNSAQLESAN